MSTRALALLLYLGVTLVRGLEYCDGEYSLCADGSCSLVKSLCGRCAPGQYVCPVPPFRCIQSSEEYTTCDGLTGTHLDWKLSEDDRISYLIGQLNQSELIGQLVNNAPEIEHVGLPAYNWLNDDEHGVKGTSVATVYPMGVGIGAAWSVDLAHEVGAAIGVEARSTHNILADKSGNNCSQSSTGVVTANGCGITLYAPNVNLVRDPRWGRAEEVYGEDPFLTAELAVGMVTGMQGNKEGQVVGDQGTALMSGACCKHYAVYQNEDHPLDRYTIDANVSNRDLWETYLPVMKACVARGKATHVMCSYNAVNGKPTCAHNELLNDILRGQWGFDGFVVSDYDAWINLKTTHHFVDSFEEAAAVGINNGMDQEGGFGTYSAIDAMPAAIAAGNVTQETLKQSVARLMRIRLRLGMLDPPSLVPMMNSSIYNPSAQCETHDKLELARRAARESIVLLQNKQKALPLSKARFGSNGGKLAVIGPQRDDGKIFLGAANYAYTEGPSLGVVTTLQGLQQVLGADRLVETDGCKNVSCVEADIDAVTSTVSDAAAAVVVIGNWFGDASYGWPLCRGDGTDGCESEAHDRTAIELPGMQVQVVQAAKKAIKNGPVVCVLLHGGAVALGGAVDGCDAIVDLWVPGQMGGTALADILFGDFSPAGRSPITFYSATSDLPDSGEFNEYPHENSNGTTYRYYVGAPPVFKFGHGLSYTEFEYSELHAPETSTACDEIELSVLVRNTGSVVSDEVVQVYASVPQATVPAPKIRLVAFQRVKAIAAHSSVRVSFTIKSETFAVVYPSSSPYVPQLAVEKGTLLLDVGGMQPGQGTLQAKVTIGSSSMLHEC